MENTNNNVRTLIVSFVVAIMALIPLRFVEAGQEINYNPTKVMVLGETTSQKEVVLPNAEIKLESPYNEIENQKSCFSQEEINLAWDSLKSGVENGQIEAKKLNQVVTGIIELEQNKCK